MNEGENHDKACESKPVHRAPKLSIKVANTRFGLHVAVLCVVIGIFTVFAVKGIELPETVYDAVGSSTNADNRSEVYNFRSGLCMAFFEVFIGWWIEKFQPTFIVFLHNWLWSPNDSSTPSKFTYHWRSAVIVIAPVAVVLTLGNSIRGFQATPTTVGYNSTMILDDFKKSQSNLERLQAKAVSLHPGERRPTDTILKSAVLQKSTPFGFVKNGACTQENSSVIYAGQSVAPMAVDDFAFTGVVYGFYKNEWNTEVNFMNTSSDANYSFTYAEARGNSIWPKEFDFSNMLNLFFHGSVMVDRAIANSEQRQHYCTLSDGRNDLDKTPDSSISTDEWTYDDDGYRICQGPATSLFTLVNAAAEMTSESINDLSDVIIKTLDVSFPSALELNATKISMEKRNLTEQIQVEALTIDVVLKTSTSYGLSVCEYYNNIPCEDSQVRNQPVPGSNDTVDLSTLYVWDIFSTSFCGNTSCAFVDLSNTFHLQKEIAAIPLMDCMDVQYNGNYGGWYPTDCTKSENQAVLYGIGSYISGDSFGYGGLGGEYNISGNLVDLEFGPYIENPRRHIQFSFALLSWNATPLQEEFDAQCNVFEGEECTGIWYQLPQTERYLFAGVDRIPVDIIDGDFHSPTPLVQLNTPTPMIHGDPIELEYLNFDNFKSTKWDASLNQVLANDSCSSLMEAYLHQLKDNNYFLERPLEVMYTSAFFYLLQNAGVTELAVSPSPSSPSDRLAHVELKGDRQLRKIALSIPIQSFWISCAGCALVIFLAIIVIVFPVPNAEYFKPDTSTAEKYVAMKTNATYPGIVYRKTLKPAKATCSDADAPTMDMFKVESMMLLHQSGDTKQYIELR